MRKEKILYYEICFSEVLKMDKIDLPIIGIGLFATIQIMNQCFKGDKHGLGRGERAEAVLNSQTPPNGQMQSNSQENQSAQTLKSPKPPESISPGIALNEFTSNRYRISFKYPKGWTKNPRYEDKYEGASGFFEVGDFSGVGENIDEAVQMQVNEEYKPYGSNPTIRRFTVDGQPARVIYPSADQTDFFKDREAAIVVQYPQPVTIDGRPFDYVVIWASKEYIPLIMSTFKFVR